jgi:hypothetical protein
MMMVKLLKFAALLSALSLALPVAATADSDNTTLFGERPVSYYKNEVKRAKRTFYERYNEVASEEDFKVHCNVGRKLAAHAV